MSTSSVTFSESRSHEIATQLAETAGLTPTDMFFDILPRRHQPLIDQWCSVADDNREIWPGVLSNLCKRFLPSLIEAYKALPSANGIHALLLTAIVANSYFRDFMSLGLAPDLLAFYARQLRINNTWSRSNPDTFRASLETLKHLLYYARKFRRADPLSPSTELALAKWLGRQGLRSMEAAKIKIVRARWQAYDERMEHAINCHRDNADLCFALQAFILTPQADPFRLLVTTTHLERTYIGSGISAAGRTPVLSLLPLSPASSRPESCGSSETRRTNPTPNLNLNVNQRWTVPRPRRVPVPAA
ncbi:hypothetical protein FB45DRAFT_923317 [Roridomyces roridus]|uniref:Uncharacterized protein n=1 Tax=Roridomyces roridus TaxID=1738132 RepID=A0AAD7FKG6_9AGAR|nr:hypothetical protein FB45DRAFT_923317 [Roridomyces roridus]